VQGVANEVSGLEGIVSLSDFPYSAKCWGFGVWFHLVDAIFQDRPVSAP